MKWFKRRSNTDRITVCFGHDVLNYLNCETQNGFDDFNRYVSGWYTKKYGEEALNTRIFNIMQRDNVDLYEALKNHLAESFDFFMTDKKMIVEIKRTNSSLYNDLRNWAKDFANRMNTAMDLPEFSEKKDSQAFASVRKNIEYIKDVFDI